MRTTLLFVNTLRILPWIATAMFGLHSARSATKPENLASQNGFEAQLWLVDGAKFESTDADEIPKEAFLTRISRSRKAHAFFLLKNPARDDENNSNVTARVIIRRPDGSILKEIRRLALWTLRQPFQKDKLGSTMNYIPLKLTDNDPNGEYTIEAWVSDNVSRGQLYLKSVLRFE